MLGEINNDFYCWRWENPEKNCCCFIACRDVRIFECNKRHRKYPAPGQFKEEYGVDYANDRPVWIYSDEQAVSHKDNDWMCLPLIHAKIASRMAPNVFIVCACTPFGKPDKGWRP